MSSLDEDRYQLITENVPVQIWTSLPNGQLDFVTEQTAQNFGLSVAVLVRDGWKDVVHPEDLPLAVERWTHALGTGTPYEVEFRLRMADGTYAWHLARALAQRADDGSIVRWLGTNTNIESQREERRRVQALLEVVVEQAKASEALITSLRAANAELTSRLAALDPAAR